MRMGVWESGMWMSVNGGVDHPKGPGGKSPEPGGGIGRLELWMEGWQGRGSRAPHLWGWAS